MRIPCGIYSQPDENYTYDLLGNRKSGGYGGQVYDAANRLLIDNKFTYTYDGEGNLKTKTDRAIGTVTSYDWDVEHRLRAAHLPSGQVETFRYDPLGRRIEIGDAVGAKHYVYGADQNIQAEFDGSNGPVASYVFGSVLDMPLSMRRGSTVDYYEQDALGSVGSSTSSTATVSQRYQYGAFGEVNYSSDSTGNPFTFTGRELDTATKDYYYRARWFAAGTGRFTGSDAVASLNAFTYCGNQPQAIGDPSGMSSLEEESAAIDIEETIIKSETGFARAFLRNSAVRHIVDQHFAESQIASKSKFLANITQDGLRGLVSRALNGDVLRFRPAADFADRYILESRFAEQIGFAGEEAGFAASNELRVVLQVVNGELRVITAFPV